MVPIEGAWGERTQRDRYGESFALQGLGIAQLRRGKLTEAGSLLRRALTTAEDSQHRLAEAHALSGLGELAIAAGQPGDAVGRLRKAITLFRQVRVPLSEAQTLIMLSKILRALGDRSAADWAMARVCELADEVDDWAGRALRKHLESIGGYVRPASVALLSGPIG
ncbi:tetratricopeptide repeat protein [Streptosporangium sp. NPDC023615]|uniref:tetratricopeptide repeat protein n=1 Tax=Streptosporangium sp. NPDC023615 TaxID=3154794 RepID=UPI00342B9EEE